MKSIYKTCINGEFDELKKRRNEIDEIIEDVPNDGDDLREDEDDLSFAVAFCKDHDTSLKMYKYLYEECNYPKHCKLFAMIGAVASRNAKLINYMYNNINENEKVDFLGELDNELAITDHPSSNVFIEYALFELNKD
jgi:hypothetical protein|tara:strand:- start:3361 stop:3771 length:411 start_codon:yes stop_codon:yes gene_type:complete